MENNNMKGHWVGIFCGDEKNTTINFTEHIEPKKWLMTPLVKVYSKYHQIRSVRDLTRVLKRL